MGHLLDVKDGLAVLDKGLWSVKDQLERQTVQLTKLNGKVAEHERKWSEYEFDRVKRLAKDAGRAEVRAEDKQRASFLIDLIGKDVVKVFIGSIGTVVGYLFLRAFGYV